MLARIHAVLALTILALCSASGLAQKVKVDYDKTVDFSKYKSYSILPPERDPAMPLLYAQVVGSIEQELAGKGLKSVDKDGDLILLLAGGTDFGLGSIEMNTGCDNCKAPLRDPKEWPGKSTPTGPSGKPMPKGRVELSFVDRTTNKAVWAGWVEQKLDAEKKAESLEKADKAIQKLLRDFPPKAK